MIGREMSNGQISINKKNFSMFLIVCQAMALLNLKGIVGAAPLNIAYCMSQYFILVTVSMVHAT